MTDLVNVTDDGAVRIIRMNRPDKKNALTAAMYTAMAEAINEANTNAAINCMVIAGSPGAFSAGNDIAEFVQAATSGANLARPAMPFLYSLANNKKPLVAAVSGVAVGVGVTMLLHCDQVIAATDARLTTPFISLGILPEAASSLIAPRLLGHQRAFSLLVMGQPLGAQEAKEQGIVNMVVPPEELDAAAMKVARTIASLPPQGVATARRLMRGTPDEILARIDEEAKLFAERLSSPEARAAFQAFMTRKK
jgi:enoyl-CoA hydratase/carnithine racemase